MAVALLFCAGPLVAQGQEARETGERPDPKVVAQKMVAGWEKELEAEEQLARHGELGEQPKPRSVGGLLDVQEHIVTGHEKLVARALRLSALRHLVSRDQRSALWAIEAARLFWPQVTEDLGSFGTDGQRLRRLLDKDKLVTVDARPLDLTQHGVLPPHPAAPIRLRYPPPARVAKLEGTVSLRVFIDRSGDGHWPELVDKTTSTRATSLLLAALNAVRDTHFKAATKHGLPMPSFYTVDLKFRNP